MSVIVINGKRYTGNSVSISGNKVIIDGKLADSPDSKNINIQIEGNIEKLDVDVCDKISVYGEVGKIKTQSGDVRVKGPVSGDVSTMSGDVTCGDVAGKVKTMSGDINKR